MRVQIQGIQSGKVTTGEIRIQTWTAPERFKLAAKVWAGCWGIAVFSILIPILHFILPPTLFLGGPALAAYFYRRESAITGGSGPCPECQQTFQIARGANRFPLSDVCERCHKGLEITLT